MSSGTNLRSPSPDFSSLSSEELERLEGVLQRQVLIENEQNQRLSGLRRTMFHLQQTIDDDDRQRSTQSSISIFSSSTTTTTNPTLVQCYICYSSIDIPTSMTVLSSPILCADCHRPVCRRCGNYTSPEFVHMPFDNSLQRQTQTSKWRCRMCIVRREVVRKSGMCTTREREREELILLNKEKISIRYGNCRRDEEEEERREKEMNELHFRLSLSLSFSLSLSLRFFFFFFFFLIHY